MQQVQARARLCSLQQGGQRRTGVLQFVHHRLCSIGALPVLRLLHLRQPLPTRPKRFRKLRGRRWVPQVGGPAAGALLLLPHTHGVVCVARFTFSHVPYNAVIMWGAGMRRAAGVASQIRTATVGHPSSGRTPPKSVVRARGRGRRRLLLRQGPAAGSTATGKRSSYHRQRAAAAGPCMPPSCITPSWGHQKDRLH